MVMAFCIVALATLVAANQNALAKLGLGQSTHASMVGPDVYLGLGWACQGIGVLAPGFGSVANSPLPLRHFFQP